MITQKQLAEKAGVSYFVVNRVLNDRPVRVSEATRQRIWSIAKKHDYQPNGLVTGLRTQRTHALGVMLPGIGLSYYARLLDGMERAAVERGWQLLLCQTHSQEAVLEREMAQLRKRRVDGIILTPHSQSRLYLERLLANGQRMVQIDNQIPGLPAPCVRSDDRAGARMATEHLLDCGHTRIAYLGLFDEVQANTTERLQGYREALAGRGLAIDPALTVFSERLDVDAGRRGTAKLLAEGVPFTALFASTDPMAIGAMIALREAGRSVPQDVSVVGYGNINEGLYVSPALTTIDQKPEESGAWAVQLMLDGIEEGTPLPYRVHLSTPELILRESCGSLAHGEAILNSLDPERTQLHA